MSTARTIVVTGIAFLLVVGMGAAPVAGQDLVTLTVTVETASGEQVPGAELTASWDGGEATETTASNGKAFLDVPSGADVTIEVGHSEYIRNYRYEVEDASESEVDITVYDRASATFEVADSEGPVSDAVVTLFRHNGVSFAEKTVDGQVSTGDIEEGEYDVTVEKPGYYDEVFELEINGSTTETVEIERGTVNLRVNVTDPYFDPPRPIEGVTATVEGVGSVQTQSNGIQQINAPVNTELAVQFQKNGYRTVQKTVKIEESDITLNANLRRSPEINVTVLNDQVVVGQPVFLEVVDEYDDPVANASISLDGEEVAQTDEDGRARLSLESEGEHTIQVAKGGVDSGPKVVNGVVSEEETPVTETTTTTTTAETTPTAETTETSAPIPGFGPIVGLLGVLIGVSLLALRRR